MRAGGIWRSAGSKRGFKAELISPTRNSSPRDLKVLCCGLQIVPIGPIPPRAPHLSWNGIIGSCSALWLVALQALWRSAMAWGASRKVHKAPISHPLISILCFFPFSVIFNTLLIWILSPISKDHSLKPRLPLLARVNPRDSLDFQVYFPQGSFAPKHLLQSTPQRVTSTHKSKTTPISHTFHKAIPQLAPPRCLLSRYINPRSRIVTPNGLRTWPGRAAATTSVIAEP